MALIDAIARQQDELTRWRRDLHAHPELGFEEERTADFVARKLEEFGVELSDDIEVRVWDSSAELRYLVLPRRPAGTEGLSEDELAALVTRDSMIGTALVEAPAS